MEEMESDWLVDSGYVVALDPTALIMPRCAPQALWVWSLGTPPEEPWEPDHTSALDLGRGAVGDLIRQPVTVARLASRTVGSALALRRRNRSDEAPPPPAPFSAPRTSLQRSLGPHRRIAFTEVSLDKVKAVKNTFGGTVNDVILAIVCGMLDGYLREAGVEPDQLPRDPVALVPVT